MEERVQPLRHNRDHFCAVVVFVYGPPYPTISHQQLGVSQPPELDLSHENNASCVIVELGLAVRVSGRENSLQDMTDSTQTSAHCVNMKLYLMSFYIYRESFLVCDSGTYKVFSLTPSLLTVTDAIT